MVRRPWLLALVIFGTVLFVLAVRPDVYEATSPSTLSWHVLLRKAYSIGAFAVMGYLTVRAFAMRRPVTVAAFAIAAYSLAIEIGQRQTGSHEGLRWNAFDVACGFVGGALGAMAAVALRRLRAKF